MLPFKRILFPVDFSAQSIGAARYVEAFTGRFDADLTLLYVIDLPQYNDLLPQSPTEKRARLHSFLENELGYFRVHRMTGEGDAAQNILRVAKERDADLIMMPTHGLGPFRQFLLGSVTAKVLHDADCPVWTGVHLESAPPLEKIEIRKLLCAVNLDAHAATVLTCAREFATEYRAELSIVHVVSSSQDAAEVRGKLAEMAGSSAMVEVGEPSQVVAEVARRTGAELVVIGRSPAPGVFGRLRTHSYPIIRQSPCPVISV